MVPRGCHMLGTKLGSSTRAEVPLSTEPSLRILLGFFFKYRPVDIKTVCIHVHTHVYVCTCVETHVCKE